MRPHRQQSTRLRRPWDSPGKNTGVGCHFLLQCMKVKSEREVAQLCATLRNPMDCSQPGSSIHGIFQARVLEWGAIAFSVMHSWALGIKPSRPIFGLSEARPSLPSSEEVQTSESPLPVANGSSLRQKTFYREQMNIYHLQLFFPS